MLYRKCLVCGIEATSEEELVLFVKKKEAKFGRRNKCKECASKEHKEKWSKEYEKKRKRPDGYVEFRKKKSYEWYIRSTYGLEINDFIKKLEENNYRCEICNRHQEEVYRMVVDHCHDTLRTRGVLCHSCNSNLGYFEDDLKKGILTSSKSKTFSVGKAFEYIKKYNFEA